MHKGMKGALIASAVAGLFVANQAFASDAHGAAEGHVKCMGINECKAKGACAVKGGHGCAGQNACKGKAWVNAASAEECTKKGGTVVE